MTHLESAARTSCPDDKQKNRDDVESTWEVMETGLGISTRTQTKVCQIISATV